MNFKLKILFITFLISIIVSCDCLFKVNGLILDSKTYKPISEVTISLIENPEPYDEKELSTENGEFEISKVSGICNENMIYFSKKGYNKTSKLFNNLITDTIFLEEIIK